MHGLGLWAHPFRYVDNIVGIRSGHKSLDTVLKYFESVLGITLQIEGEGQQWTSLEAELSIDPQTALIQVAMKQKGSKKDPVHKQLLRFPDCHSPNAKWVLRSLAGALFQKTVIYSSSLDIALNNVNRVCTELSAKGYPLSWWKPYALKALTTMRFNPLSPKWVNRDPQQLLKLRDSILDWH